MTGCGNEMDEAGTQAGKQVTMTMQAATDAPQTRADYTDDGTKMSFPWRNGDALSVVVDGVPGNENCELSTSQAGKSVPFSGTVTTFEGSKAIYAFYPHKSGGYTVNGGNAELTLPNPQAYTVDGAIDNSFMVGVGTATATGTAIDASAGLKQVMSIIKLNITNAPAAVTGVRLKCSEAVFPTMATVKLSDATISNPGTSVSELSMTVTDGTTPATKAISFAMFPTDLSGKKITIEVMYADGKSKSIEKDGTNFERNIHYVMDFNSADFIEVNGIKVAVGSLVFNPASNKVEIGTATDNGLYFQFGSLVGWSSTGNPTIAVKPANFDNSGTKEDWRSTDKIWQGTTGTVPFTTAGSGSDDEKAGIGDPCRYYLGGTWRLPTEDEYKALFNNVSGQWAGSGGWSWTTSPAPTSATHTNGLKIPASGRRASRDGGLSPIGTTGYYWSASPTGNNGIFLNFASSFVYPRSNIERTSGLSVRCVQGSN